MNCFERALPHSGQGPPFLTLVRSVVRTQPYRLFRGMDRPEDRPAVRVVLNAGQIGSECVEVHGVADGGADIVVHAELHDLVVVFLLAGILRGVNELVEFFFMLADIGIPGGRHTVVHEVQHTDDVPVVVFAKTDGAVALEEVVEQNDCEVRGLDVQGDADLLAVVCANVPSKMVLASIAMFLSTI